VQTRRTATRHSVTMPATLTIGEESSEQTIKNLSLGGAYVETSIRVAMGTRVQLSFRVPTQEAPIETSGQVRWSAEGGIGIQFDGLRAREVWSLSKYFEQLPGSDSPE
jgi:hypothetical protein